MRIRSQRVAQDYETEFDEMYRDNRFGPESEANTPNPQVTVNGVPVEVYFSPDDRVAREVVAELRGANQSIDFLAYSFTSDAFARTMLERAGAGVRVRGVFDQSQVESNTGGEYENLLRSGLPVRLDGIPGLLHDKVIIIDGQTVITGSYNFSRNAEERNDENLVINHDPRIAALYLAEFERIYATAKE